MQREDPLDTFVGDDASNRDGSIDASPLHADEDALEHLHSFLFTFDDSHMHIDGVADGEVVEFLTVLELFLRD